MFAVHANRTEHRLATTSDAGIIYRKPMERGVIDQRVILKASVMYSRPYNDYTHATQLRHGFIFINMHQNVLKKF